MSNAEIRRAVFERWYSFYVCRYEHLEAWILADAMAVAAWLEMEQINPQHAQPRGKEAI